MSQEKLEVLTPTNSQIIFIDQQLRWLLASSQSTGKY
jgi:hypothetical protein